MGGAKTQRQGHGQLNIIALLIVPALSTVVFADGLFLTQSWMKSFRLPSGFP